MRRLMGSLKRAVSDGLEETTTLAKILTEIAADTPGLLRLPCCTSKGRTEAINGGLEHTYGDRPGIPQPHPRRTPQRPPDNNHLNQTTSPAYHTLKREEPLMFDYL